MPVLSLTTTFAGGDGITDIFSSLDIKDTTLQEALEKPGFKDLWNIKKDDIDVCKDCEFRHICTDCRAFIKDENDIYSQPAKCGYNPYIAKWESQEGYITVEEWRKSNNNELAH